MAPSTMKAFALGHRSWWEILFNGIRYRDISHGAQIKTVPTPKISPSEVLVKVRAVACVRSPSLGTSLAMLRAHTFD